MAARREGGVWINASGEPATIVVGPDGTSISAALTPAHTAPTVTNSSGVMLAANTSRKYAMLQNDGAVDVYIKIGATAVINAGIRLLANGGAYELGSAFGNLSTLVINGITVSGTAVVLVTEEA